MLKSKFLHTIYEFVPTPQDVNLSRHLGHIVYWLGAKGLLLLNCRDLTFCILKIGNASTNMTVSLTLNVLKNTCVLTVFQNNDIEKLKAELTKLKEALNEIDNLRAKIKCLENDKSTMEKQKKDIEHTLEGLEKKCEQQALELKEKHTKDEEVTQIGQGDGPGPRPRSEIPVPCTPQRKVFKAHAQTPTASVPRSPQQNCIVEPFTPKTQLTRVRHIARYHIMAPLFLFNIGI